MANLLITGGAGFIGSHACVVLLEAGHEIVVLDDFSNSSPVALERAQELGGGSISCVHGDIRDSKCLNRIFENAQEAATRIEAVIHFAGLKAVGESVAEPLRYWDVNLRVPQTDRSTDAHDCRTLCSAAQAPYTASPRLSRSPKPHPQTRSTLRPIQTRRTTTYSPEPMGPGGGSLRYFNPVGAHPSGLIGEALRHSQQPLPLHHTDRSGPAQDTARARQRLPTPDGTGIRDYLHVMDLAEAHHRSRAFLKADSPTSLLSTSARDRG